MRALRARSSCTLTTTRRTHSQRFTEDLRAAVRVQRAQHVNPLREGLLCGACAGCTRADRIPALKKRSDVAIARLASINFKLCTAAANTIKTGMAQGDARDKFVRGACVVHGEQARKRPSHPPDRPGHSLEAMRRACWAERGRLGEAMDS